ncbi:MAG: endonuclease [Bacteroidota bacterium]
MKFLLSLAFTCITLSSTLIAQVDTVLYSDLSGDNLYNQVRTDFTARRVLTYGPARDVLYGEIYKVQDSVSCVYTGHTLYLMPGADPSSFLFQNGSDNGINTEHTWPRSKGADDGSPLADMHHLFPTRAIVNEIRSNYSFGDIDDDDTDFWYIDNMETRTKPTERIDEYSEFKFGTFEPREDHKGNVARAMFYFYTIYRADAQEADPTFFEEQRETLCEWHFLDPVDSLEYDRTFKIARYQDRKTNPFVLDCSLAKRLYCEETNTACATVVNTNEILLADTRATISPNPNNGQSQLQFTLLEQANVELVIVNALGQATSVNTSRSLGSGDYQWDINLDENGIYTAILRINNGKQTQQIARRLIVSGK